MRNEGEREKVLRLGRQSLDMLNKDQNFTWWLDVGEALIMLRAEAMAKACTNRPEGGAYNRIFGAALHDEKLEFDKGDRSRLFEVMDNRLAIEEWRGRLSPHERRKLNHPSTVLRKWKAATRVPEPDEAKGPSPMAKMKDVNYDLMRENNQLKAHIKDLEDARADTLDAERCSFCDATKFDHLLEGKNACICDECVARCADMVAEKMVEAKTAKQPAEPVADATADVPAEAKPARKRGRPKKDAVAAAMADRTEALGKEIFG